MDPYCRALASPGSLNLVISIGLLIGIIGSYLPQHHRLITRKNSFGISPYFLLLGTTSSIAGLANILLLPRSQRDVSCCREIGPFACFASVLGILQVGAQFLGFVIILILFVIYLPRSPALPGPQSEPQKTNVRQAIIVVAACILHFLATIAVSLVIQIWRPSQLQLLANCFGIMAAVLASIQYFPQIYMTFQLRRVGSLSIPMMCIQTPGSFLWAGSLAARVGWEGWSTWGVYIVTATLQGTLLIMAIYFEIVDPLKPGQGTPEPEAEPPSGEVEEGAGDRPDERTPLLAGGGSS